MKIDRIACTANICSSVVSTVVCVCVKMARENKNISLGKLSSRGIVSFLWGKEISRQKNWAFPCSLSNDDDCHQHWHCSSVGRQWALGSTAASIFASSHHCKYCRQSLSHSLLLTKFWPHSSSMFSSGYLYLSTDTVVGRVPCRRASTAYQFQQQRDDTNRWRKKSMSSEWRLYWHCSSLLGMKMMMSCSNAEGTTRQDTGSLSSLLLSPVPTPEHQAKRNCCWINGKKCTQLIFLAAKVKTNLYTCKHSFNSLNHTLHLTRIYALIFVNSIYYIPD